jgi:two-component system phosphate regulon response regulator OmpR
MTSQTGPARHDPPPDNAPHLLIVDDDLRIRELMTRYLKEQGFRVTPAGDVETARAAMRGLAFDIVILDVMMPGDESGLDLARSLRAISPIPILMVTALDDKLDRLKGLEAGVDDYMTKPFEPEELVWRLQNILKRGQALQGPREEVRMGKFIFHAGRGELRRGDDSIKITERERDLLRMFALRPATPIPRHELAHDESTGNERAIDVQINRLRRKIEDDPSNPIYLQTVRGKGYILYVD